ncbi:MAG: DUF1707 SHOCT-like domain-containing protein [Marmoricola sp.]
MSDAAAVAWDRFSSDPRSEHNAALRASDLDRSVALDALASAYADGRLDREEYDERSTVVQTGKTLGELVTPLRDLAPDPATGGALALSSPAAVQTQAEQKYAHVRRNALSGFLVPSLICWVVWIATSLESSHFNYPWPIWVTLGTSIRLIQVYLNKQAIIESSKEKIQRKEQRRIEERPR